MKHLSPWILRLAVLIVLQAGLGGGMEIGGVKPDFFLLSVVLVAMKQGFFPAMVWGVVAGTVQDVLSGGVVGFNLLTKPLVGLAAGLLRAKLDFDNPNTQALVTLLATLVDGLILSVLLYAFHPSKPVSLTLSRVVLPEAIYNGLLIPLLLPAARLVKQWLSSLRRETVKLAG